MKIILIKTDNTYQILELAVKPNFKDLQAYVNGNIEHVNLKDNIGYYINEEGKFTDEPNILATAYWYECLDMTADDYIAGNVVIIGTDEEGDNEGLTDIQVEEFESFNKNLTNEQLEICEKIIGRYT